MQTSRPRRIAAALVAAIAVAGAALPEAEEPASAEETSEIRVDESGRRYRAVVYPKGVEGVTHVRRPGGWLQVQHGLRFEILEERDESFVLKVPVAEPAAAPEPAPPPEPQSEPVSTPASPPPELPEVDRLELVPFDAGLPRSGQWRNGFDVADLDGDGHLDIVFGPARKGRPRPNVFRGDGAGNWSRWDARFPDLPYDYGDAAVADFDGDGRADVALAMHLRGFAVLISDGEGGFESMDEGLELADPGEPLPEFTSRALEAVDWDADGRTDLVALGEGPRVALGPGAAGQGAAGSRGIAVFRNLGDGGWERLVGESWVFGDGLATGDFDGDGRPDVATASRSLGERRIVHFNDGGRSWRVEHLADLPRRGLVLAVAAGDLDGDGRDELVAGSVRAVAEAEESAIEAFYAGADGSWTRTALVTPPDGAQIYSLALGDLDGDGRRDLAYGTGDGQIGVLLGLPGQRGFARELSPELAGGADGCRVYALALPDLDADGRAELVAASAGEAGGFAALAGPPDCAQGGSVRVWRPRRKPS